MERLCGLVSEGTGDLGARVRSLQEPEFAAPALDLLDIGWVS